MYVTLSIILYSNVCIYVRTYDCVCRCYRYVILITVCNLQTSEYFLSVGVCSVVCIVVTNMQILGLIRLTHDVYCLRMDIYWLTMRNLHMYTCCKQCDIGILRITRSI